jgi:hypothetical protein
MLMVMQNMATIRNLFEAGHLRSDSSCLAADQFLRDLLQIGRENAPAHPASQASFPMGQTSVQPEPTAQDTDPPLNARAEPEASAKPGGPFSLPALRRRLARIRNHQLLDPDLLRLTLTAGRVDATVAGHQPWRVTEPDHMAFQTGQQVGMIGARLRDDPLLSEEPPSTSASQTLQPNSTGLPGLCRWITWVWGSNRLTSFSAAGTITRSRIRWCACRMACRTRGR